MNLKRLAQEAFEINRLRELAEGAGSGYNDAAEKSWNRGYKEGYKDGKAGKNPKLPFDPND